MRSLLLVCLCAFSLPFSLFSNDQDSLFQIWNDTEQSPKERAIAFNNHIQPILYQNPDSALVLLDELEIFTSQHQLKEEAATLNRAKGVAFAFLRNPEKSVTYFNKAKSIFEELEDKKGATRVEANIASVYAQNGEYDKALEVYKEIESRPLMSDNGIAQLVYSNLGGLYGQQENYKPAIEYLNKSLNLLSDDSNQKALVLANVATNYIQLEEYEIAKIKINEALELGVDLTTQAFIYTSLGVIAVRSSLDTLEAIKHFEKAVSLAEENKIYHAIVNPLQELALISYELKNHDKSISYINRLFEITGEDSEEVFVIQLQACLGKNLIAKNQIGEAKKHCEKSLKLAKTIASQSQIAYACECLRDIAQKEGNLTEALALSKEVYENAIAASKNDRDRKITKLSMNYEFDREKEQIALIQKQKEDLLIVQNKQTRIAAFGLGAFGLLALAFLFNARRKNKLISAQKEQLESLNHTKDRIFAIIGHDLRKPAASFRGISKKVRYLIKKQDFETLDVFGEQIERNALSLNKLTDNLLNWALTQRNVMPYNPIEVRVDDIINDISTIFSSLASDKNIEILSDVPQDLNVYADPVALSTILTNLVDNAIKYTPEGGQIRIDAQSDSGNQIKIRVSDNGVGMESDKINDLFLLKKDKSKKGTSGEKGTGLGLHLVKELVELNKGVIKAVSDFGKGSSFEITFPNIQIV